MLNRTLTLILAFAAGLLGGTLSHNGVPTGAFAQAQSTAPKEIRAQRFTLVDENGRMRGVFAIEPTSSPAMPFNPEMMIDTAGDWKILYRPKAPINFRIAGLMPLDELESYLSSFTPNTSKRSQRV